MKIKSIALQYAEKSGFTSTEVQGMCHIKTLPFLSVVQAVEGHYQIQLNDGPIHSTGKSGFFVAPADAKQTIIHNVDLASKRMTNRWVFLKIKINDEFYLDDLFDFPVILPDRQKEEMNALFNRLFNTDDLVEEYICNYEIIRILLSVASEKAIPANSKIYQILEYIKNNYHKKITVQELARRANRSESGFFAYFKRCVGVSPTAYINNLRLSIASEKLVSTDKPVGEIALSVGVDDPVYFNKLFRKHYGISPSKYRGIYKAVDE